jgi:hypothetical protein
MDDDKGQPSAPTPGSQEPTEGFIAASVAQRETVAAEEAPDDWEPPKVREDGVYTDANGLPLNLRLRAAALVDQGADEDPDGLVDADQLKAARSHLAAYDKTFPALEGATKGELEKIAEKERVSLEGAANNEERAALIAARRPVRTF